MEQKLISINNKKSMNTFTYNILDILRAHIDEHFLNRITFDIDFTEHENNAIKHMKNYI